MRFPSLVIYGLAAVLAGCSPKPAHEAPVAAGQQPSGKTADVDRQLAPTPADGGPAGAATSVDPGSASAPSEPFTSSQQAAPGSRSADADTAPAVRAPRAEPTFADVTIPAGTELAVDLETPVASDASTVEDTVRARVDAPVRVDGRAVVPAGASITGSVVEATRSGKVKGRGRIAVRFTTLRLPGGDDYPIRTGLIAREARGTKGKDATKIGGGAAAGAVVGGLLGGKKGAAIGSAVGGGAGTAVVLNQRGEEAHLPAGSRLRVRLTAPVTVRVPAAR